MIRELHIENFVVIERATVLFDSGLIAVTGASGAGKSVLLSALSLACGARSESDVVRAGCDEARIDLRIETTNEDGAVVENVLSRVIPREGRSRAYIDGRPSTAFALAEMSSDFVEIHGQHEQHRLGSTRVRSDLLDDFGEISRESTDRLSGDVAALKAEMATLGGTATERQREIDFLEYQLREIDDVSPQPGELVDLQTEEKLLSDVDRVRSVANDAIAILDNDDDLRSLLRELEQVESFEGSAARLHGALAELSDIANDLRSQVSELEEDPSRLNYVRERISSLKGLCRRYGETIHEVLSYRDQIAEQSERLQHHDVRFQDLEASLAVAEKEYLKAADDLRRERSDRAPVLAQEVNGHLAMLGMPYSRFEVEVDGIDGGAVDFLFSSNGSDELRTLGKVASGGETARCMLALDLAAGRRSGSMCTVFDEIDSGVDASAGEAIAHALRQASEDRQIVVVTHLATVAAAADAHLVVTKEHINGSPNSVPNYVQDAAREQEIARMLTGSHDEESVTVARRLLDR